MQEQEVKARMEKSLENLKKNFGGVRTGRANPALVEHLMVDAYGQKMPLKQIASVHVPENRTLSITPFDRGNAQAIEKAISSSEMGLTPRNEGHVIYIRLPELTADRRKELEKIVKNMAEDAKVAIRNVRRDSIDAVKKEGVLSQDEQKHYQDRIQKITDEYNHKIDELLSHKEAEIREI